MTMTEERTEQNRKLRLDKELHLAKVAYQTSVDAIYRIYKGQGEKKDKRIAAAKGIHQAHLARIEQDYNITISQSENVENEGG